MKKKLIVILMWMGVVGVALAQSIQGLGPASSQSDGQNTGLTTLYIYPQVQPTIIYNASPTPSPLVPQPTQVSNWLPLNTKQAFIVEAGSNTFTGYYAVQVSNNPTPVATNVSNIHTIMRDDATWATGGQGEQTFDWLFNVASGWKYMRFVVIPESGNTGTLNLSARVFANDGNVQELVNNHSYTNGVQWKSAENIVAPNTVLSSGSSSVPITLFYDYKVPQGASGLNLYNNVAGVSGASTITSYICEKDPVSGILQQVAAGTTTHAAGFLTISCVPSYASPYPVATPPTGQTIVPVHLPQDVVVEDILQGTGATTLSQNIVPIQ